MPADGTEANGRANAAARFALLAADRGRAGQVPLLSLCRRQQV
jgi:hypothetical protein